MGNLSIGLDYFLGATAKLVIGESTASQLPGRQNGGAADAYRHVLFSAELTRSHGQSAAFYALNNHETEITGGADNGLDFWNNSIGMQIGNYVSNKCGNWVA